MGFRQYGKYEKVTIKEAHFCTNMASLSGVHIAKFRGIPGWYLVDENACIGEEKRGYATAVLYCPFCVEDLTDD